MLHAIGDKEVPTALSIAIPVTLTFKPEELRLVVAAVGKLPYEHVAGLMASIYAQLVNATPAAPSPPTIAPEGS